MITVKALNPSFDFPVKYEVRIDGILSHMQIVEYPSGRFPVDIIDGETDEVLDTGFRSIDSATEYLSEVS